MVYELALLNVVKINMLLMALPLLVGNKKSTLSYLILYSRCYSQSKNKNLFPQNLMKLRVFTENLHKNIPSFRFPLKLSASTLPHSSYNLPFYFDHAHLLSYRVQAFARAFSLNKEQRKYFIGFDLGVKQHKHLSSNSFVSFKRFSSFGNLTYRKSTMLSFFRTLNRPKVLYVPFKRLSSGSFIKTPRPCGGSPGWNVDALPEIFKKRLNFTRKLHTQNEDVDLMISGTQRSWAGAFSPWPSAATFFLLMPTRYSSFIISSYMQPRRLAFPYRFFRYFHKYFVRKGYWSSSILSFWKQVAGARSSNFNTVFTNFFSLTQKKISFFICFKLLIVLFLASVKAFGQLLIHPLVRFFWHCIFFENHISLVMLSNIFLNFSPKSFKTLFTAKAVLKVTYSNIPMKIVSNSLFDLNHSLRKYLIVNVGRRLNVFCHHGYYRPWVKRFALSFNSATFLKVFPKPGRQGKRNSIAHPRFRKDTHRYNWNLFNPFGKLQTRVFKWLRKLLLVFLRNQPANINFANKLPVMLTRFFQFARTLFKGGSSYTKMLFDNKHITSAFVRSPKKNSVFLEGSSFFNSFSRAFASKLMALRQKNRSLSLKAKTASKFKLILLQKKNVRWGLFSFFFSVVLRRFISNRLLIKSPFINNWSKIYPHLVVLTNTSFPLAQLINSQGLSNLSLGRNLFKDFQGTNLSKHFPKILFTRQVVNKFLNDLEARYLSRKRKSAPYTIYTSLRLLFQALGSRSSLIRLWWKAWGTNYRLTNSLHTNFYNQIGLVFIANQTQNLWGVFWKVLLTAHKLYVIFFFKHFISYDFNFIVPPLSSSLAIRSYYFLLKRPFIAVNAYNYLYEFELDFPTYNLASPGVALDKQLFSFVIKNQRIMKYISSWADKRAKRLKEIKENREKHRKEAAQTHKTYEVLHGESLDYAANRAGKKKYFEKGLQKRLPKEVKSSSQQLYNIFSEQKKPWRNDSTAQSAYGSKNLSNDNKSWNNGQSGKAFTKKNKSKSKIASPFSFNAPPLSFIPKALVKLFDKKQNKRN